MKKFSLLTFVLSATSLFFLSSCNNDNCKVILNSGVGLFDDDQTVLTLTNVKKGTKLCEIEGYQTPRAPDAFRIFASWKNEGKNIDEDYVVESNVELSAVFLDREITYDVTLNANGGYFKSVSKTTKTIDNVTSISYADCPIPSRKNESDTIYHFAGWYYDKEGKKSFDFSKKLNSDLTIYAYWEPETIIPFTLKDSEDNEITKDVNNVYNITNADTYTLNGHAVDSQILINAKNANFTLILDDVAFYSPTDKAPIKIKDAANVTLTAKENTNNFIYDMRSYGDTACDEDNGAITSKSNLIINGNGSLGINDKDLAPGYKRAIHTSKLLTINDLTLATYGVDDSIRANEKIEINNANLSVISKLGDGLKTKDIDVSSSGERYGDILIEGKTNIAIDCACNAINASHDLVVGDLDNANQPIINIATSDFSWYTGDVVYDKKDLYLRASNAPDTHYDLSSYWCSIYLGNDNWERVKLKRSITNSSTTSHNITPGYYYSFSVPNDITSFEIYLFSVNQTEESITEYIKKSDAITINSRYDTIGSRNQYVDFTGNNITAPTSTIARYSSLVDSASHSCGVEYKNKGLKADNEITINEGAINIKSYDDSIHTSYGTFYPGDSNNNVDPSVGTGNVNIHGGTINITSGDSLISDTGDDGIHSGGILTIDGGLVDVKYSYEGIEAGIININGGIAKAFAYDDAVNATYQGNIENPNVYVTNGVLDVTANGNDVDGIDSNGNFEQSGGLVITRGNPSGGGGMSTGLDVNGEVKITGGALLCLGSRPESTPSYDSSVTYLSPFNGSNLSGELTIAIGDSINYTYINNAKYPNSYLYYLTSLGTPTIN